MPDDFRRTVSEYAALNAVAQALLGTLELDAVLGMSASEAAALVAGDAAAVLLLAPGSAVEFAAATPCLQPCVGSRMDRVDLFARLLDVPAEGAIFVDLQGDFACDSQQRAFTRAISVPLRVRDEAYGALVAFATAERAPFDARDRDMLAKLGKFSAIAIDNARHFRDEQHQIRQLKTLSALASEMAQLRSAHELFPAAVRIIHDEFGFEHVSILTVDSTRSELVLAAIAPETLEANRNYVLGYRQSTDVGILGYVARTGRAYLAQDTARDELFHSIENWDHARSELVLPIRVKGRVFGVVNIETQRAYAFQETDLEVMQALADLVGVGLENARLVDDARQAERQRLHAEKLATIGQLVAGLAHEINNPLAAAQSASELLLDQELADDVREAVELIRAESERAALIVRKLLDFSRPHDVELQPIDIVDAIEASLSLRAYEHRVQDLTVVRSFEPVPPVRADMHRLQQVFLNLIVNAEQAMSEPGRPRVLHIACRLTDMVEIRITDTGPGIPESDLDTIFDPFFTTKPVGQGTGLGLSVSYGIIRELGGTIKAVPHPDGARFIIRLPPLAAVVPLPATPVQPRIEEQPRLQAGPAVGLNILFVDDEPSLRRVAERYLTRLGHHVELAANGEEALQLLQARRFDVIVTDLRMPGLGGEELYLRLGGIVQQRFLFMSGDIVSEKTRRFLANTGRPYLHKPFELKRLAGLIRTIAGEPTP